MLNKKALGATAAAQALYVEDVFSTYVYTGDGGSKTITNGIDLSGEGGLVWVKCRSSAYDNILGDSERIGTNGGTRRLISNSTAAQSSTSITTFFLNNNGFETNGGGNDYNGFEETYVSWTFRKAEKFFDVVTWTGDGTFNNSRTINHSINGTVGSIIVKATSSSGTNWITWHRSLSTGYFVFLNATNAQTQLFANDPTYYPIQDVTNTTFKVNQGGNSCNSSGVTYVAYLFAHDAGGFGDSGSDNVISCGSYTGNGSGSGQAITLGYEPQFLIIKDATTGGAGRDWLMFDNMRGMFASTDSDPVLRANLSSAEDVGGGAYVTPTATGFRVDQASGDINGNGNTYIYIAIRRGPMKTPEAGTEVFSPQTASGVQTAGFPVDAFLGVFSRTSPGSYDPNTRSRLIGVPYLVTSSTAAETGTTNVGFDSNTGLTYSWPSGNVNWYFRRAPGFFDVVCYTGTGSATTVTHNLGAVPELMIVKRRDATGAWPVYANNDNTDYLLLNSTAATADLNTYWNDTSPTSSVFTVGTNTAVNASGGTYVAYLFGSVTGVSKVGSYTGTGTTLQINCGFTGGARFVLIKRTDSTGDWYVWDTARGIVSGNDPYLLMNSTAAEVTNTDYIDTYSQGFEISSTAPAAINANGGTFIYLAIA